MRLITAVILTATLPGCSTYRWDLAQCADIGLWDSAPAQCWCPSADLECLALAQIQGAVERERRASLDGQRLPDAPVSACMLHGALASIDDWPTIEPVPNGAPPIPVDVADDIGCALECFAAPRGMRREECQCR